jgi:hypothetical protein
LVTFGLGVDGHEGALAGGMTLDVVSSGAWTTGGLTWMTGGLISGAGVGV